MLHIRPEQYDTFDAATRSKYYQRLLKLFRDTIPGVLTSYSDEILLRRIAAAEERGRGWGVSLQDSMARFVALDLVMGERFEPRLP